MRQYMAPSQSLIERQQAITASAVFIDSFADTQFTIQGVNAAMVDGAEVRLVHEMTSTYEFIDQYYYECHKESALIPFDYGFVAMLITHMREKSSCLIDAIFMQGGSYERLVHRYNVESTSPKKNKRATVQVAAHILNMMTPLATNQSGTEASLSGEPVPDPDLDDPDLLYRIVDRREDIIAEYYKFAITEPTPDGGDLGLPLIRVMNEHSIQHRQDVRSSACEGGVIPFVDSYECEYLRCLWNLKEYWRMSANQLKNLHSDVMKEKAKPPTFDQSVRLESLRSVLTNAVNISRIHFRILLKRTRTVARLTVLGSSLTDERMVDLLIGRALAMANMDMLNDGAGQ